MNIGAALGAADAYYKEGDARKEREFVQAKRDSELSTLGDRTQAEKTGYQLRAGQNQQGLDTLPQDTEVKKTELATRGAAATVGLANANNDVANIPQSLGTKNNKLKGEAMTVQAQLDGLPDKLEAAAVQGVLDQQQQGEVVVGTMGQLMARGDKAAAISFANKIAAKGNLLPNTNGKTFTDIQEVMEGPQSGSYNFVASDGTKTLVPATSIKGAMAKLKSGTYKFLHTTDGSVFSGNEATGVVTQAHKGDPQAMNKQHTPAEIQTMEWLIKNGVAKDKTSAWEQVRSSREKTRNSFIMDYVAKNALPNADTAKIQEDAGRLYDSIRQNTGGGAPNPAAPPTSNNRGGGTVDEQINSLIGVPSQ